jgi:hypothetical protein
MATVKLGRRHETEYGTRYDGRVIDGKRSVPITYREPRADSDTIYINASGLSAGKATMRLGAIIGAKAGYKTVTVDYTNRSTRNCIDSYAADIAAVADAFSDDHNKRAIGLSEGGAVAVRAMLMAHFQAATLVNPAGVIENHHLSWGHGVRRVGTVLPECFGYFIKDPRAAAWLGMSCVANCAKRPFGVAGETNELRNGNEHDNIAVIMGSDNPPYLRVCSSARDGLLKGSLIEAGAKLLPIDETLVFPGGHCDWVVDPLPARTVYEHDQAAFGQPVPLPEAAMLATAA